MPFVAFSAILAQFGSYLCLLARLLLHRNVDTDMLKLDVETVEEVLNLRVEGQFVFRPLNRPNVMRRQMNTRTRAPIRALTMGIPNR